MVAQKRGLQIIIADQEPDVRQALRLLCEERLGLTVVAEATDDAELRLRLDTSPADILLLEWELPGNEPDKFIKRLKYSLHIIAISSQLETRSRALNAGARGFVYKGDAPDELINLLQNLIEKR